MYGGVFSIVLRTERQKNGYYDKATGTIWLNAQSTNPVMTVLSHELTHSLETTESYGEFRKLVLSMAGQTRSSIEQTYESQNLAPEDIDHEVVARYVEEHLLTDEAAIRDAVQRNRSFGQWMRDQLDKVLAKLGNEDARERVTLQKARDLYAQALKEKAASRWETDGRLRLPKVGEQSIEYSTSIEEDAGNHTAAEQRVIDEYKKSVDTRMLGWVQRVKTALSEGDKTAKKMRLVLDPVTDRAADDLKVIAGVDVRGYSHLISGGTIEHIDRRHGPNGIHDTTMQDDNDIARMQYVLENYDDVALLRESDGTPRTVTGYNDKNNNPAKLVIFAKKIDGTYYVVEAAPESASKKLHIISAYMQKNGGSIIRALNMNGNPSLQSTPKAPHDPIASAENSIAQQEPEVKGLSLPKVDTQQSLTEQEDIDYLAVVDRGDMETAQRMVEQAAKAAGYTIRAYHGTLDTSFTAFRKDLIGSRFSYDDQGFFFTSSKALAADYASSEFDSDRKGRTIDAYLKIGNPLIVDSKYLRSEGMGNLFRDHDVVELWDEYSQAFLDAANEQNADGIILDDGSIQMYVVMDSEQIKSAEPVTYDDSGKPIPLSERFNPENDDIRWSLSEEDEGPRGLRLPMVEDETEASGDASLREAEPQSEAPARKKTKPVAESRPIEARRWLNRQTVDKFEIPEGKRKAADGIRRKARSVSACGAVSSSGGRAKGEERTKSISGESFWRRPGMIPNGNAGVHILLVLQAVFWYNKPINERRAGYEFFAVGAAAGFFLYHHAWHFCRCGLAVHLCA